MVGFHAFVALEICLLLLLPHQNFQVAKMEAPRYDKQKTNADLLKEL